jgi:hypothetical protein
VAQIQANPWSFVPADASLFTITGVTETGFIATATTSAPHGYKVGQFVCVAGVAISPAAATVGYGYNGLVRVLSVPTTTTFTYAPLSQDQFTPLGGLGAGGAGSTGVPVYYQGKVHGADMSWQDATAADTIIVSDINGNLVFKATAPTTGTYTRNKPLDVSGLWVQQLPHGTLFVTVN